MSETRYSRREGSAPDLDISTTKSAPRSSDKRRIGFWLVWIGLVVVIFSLNFLGWSSLTLAVLAIGVIVFESVGRIVWIFIVRRGAFTWFRLARLPAKLMAKGDASAAEHALDKALRRANRFGPHDPRRGAMLVELAAFVAHQGRVEQARAMFEESIDILERAARTQPMNYFIALNNLAVFVHLDNRDYEAAQRTLEKVVDLVPRAQKASGGWAAFLSVPIPELEFVLHRNLAYVFIEMNALTEAKHHLREAEAVFKELPSIRHKAYHDHLIGVRAWFKYATGEFAEAWSECQKAKDPDYGVCLRVRAKVHLVRLEHRLAEEALRKFQTLESKKGTLHRPRLLDPTLDLAESLFGQSQHEQAFASLQEARAIVNDFKLPRELTWRRTLSLWRDRAQDCRQVELVESLEKDMQSIGEAPMHAITVLDRFRVRDA